MSDNFSTQSSNQPNIKKEVVFVDTAVTGYQSLEAGISPGMEVVEIAPRRSGLAQIAEWAETHSVYDAIHIVSHGHEATLVLGGDILTNDKLLTAAVQGELAKLGSALKPGGDLLLYGCNIAAGDDGRSFIAGLAAATGANVAASTDLTGAADKDGNWFLEAQIGKINAQTLHLADYRDVLAAFNLTTASGNSTKTVKQTVGADTMVLTATSWNMAVGDELSDFPFEDTQNVDGTIVVVGEGTFEEYESMLTITVEGGKLFDLGGFSLLDISGHGRGLKVTTNKGFQELAWAAGSDLSWSVLLSGATFQGISYAQITTSDPSNQFLWGFDNFVLNNITAPPTISESRISITSTGSGTSGIYKIGDTVTASWDNTAAGDNNAGIAGVTMDFSQFGGGSAVAATNSSGVWTASYTITAGSIDGSNKNVSVSATGSGGATNTMADATNVSVDNVAPTVTDTRISISGASGTGGAYKIGDTVTATWNNTAGGDNNADTIAGVTVDFSTFGGGSNVTAVNSGGTWTATYTITSGAIDATNRNISVTATDNAGNTRTTADTTNATVDNIGPTVTDANISISGASGTGGAFKIGDTVTATWDNTAGGDNNADTMSGVTVDFSQFGGGSAVSATNASGTWTATYTIVSGALNGATNRNIAITARDNAGNTTTTADTSNATVDNVVPVITFSSVTLSADTGASGSDFVTNTASQTITATLSGAPVGGDIVYGSLDNGSSWTDITAKVSGTTLTWDGVTLSGSNTLKLKVTDAAGNDGTVKSQAYTLDTSAPAAPSTPDMTSGTDTGSSNSDDLTSNTTPTFGGTAESGSTVTLYDSDGTTILGTTTATGGNWVINSSVLSAGAHTITAKATDVAGNTSSASSSIAVTVDNTTPTAIGLSATTITSLNATSTASIATISATDGSAITYSLAAGDNTNDAQNSSFTVSGTSLKVGGASLTAGTYNIYLAATDAAGNVANQAFTLTVVDAPSVSSIVRTGGASASVSGAASSLNYTVTFSESVTGVDASDFTLTATGTASGNIASVSGSGTTYTVTVDSISGDGTLRLDLNSSSTGIQNGGSIAIVSGYTSGSSYTLDHTTPNAPSTPDMTSATDTGGSNTDNITSNTTPIFTGTAEAGSTVTLYDTDGTTVLGTTTATGGNWSITSSALSAGSHSITAKATDAAGNTSSQSTARSVTIDTTGPSVASVTVPTNGSYSTGQTLTFTVNTDEAVVVDTAGGMPELALVIGSTSRDASYVSGSGTTALQFSYTVQSGDGDTNGITVGALSSNGGTFKDAAGNSMALTLNSVGSTVGVLVDTTAPTVDSVSVPANAAYFGGQSLDFTVNFSEAISVNTSGGTPRIAITLDTGGTVYANYLSGSGTSALTFRHVVADGELDATGVTVGALAVNGGTLRDAAGNDAVLTLNSVGSTALVNVDGTLPRIASVTSSAANGSYKAGAAISINIDLTKAVTVDTTSGTPTLALASGGTATYASGSGTSTLIFSYTVGNGQDVADLDYSSTSAISLNGATIKDSSGAHADAILTLAAPGASGSLGNSKDIVIDTTAPTKAIATTAFSADTGASASDFVTATAAQTISGTLSANLTAGETVYVSLDNGATWTAATANVGQNTWSLSNQTLTASNTLKVKVTDTAGNDGTVTSQAYTLDTSAPTFQSATVNGATLVMTYADAATLDATNLPAVSAFAVTVGGAPVAVNSVAGNVANKTVTLTIATSVSNGQAVTVAYTDPSVGDDINAIQDAAGNDAATLAATTVTNNTPAPPSDGGTPTIPKTSTVDGVLVNTQTTTNTDGSTSHTVTIPVVEATRQEQVGNNSVADIPLVTSGNTQLLTAQLPTGFGLQVSGSVAPKPAGTSTTELIHAIQAHTGAGSSDQTQLTGGGSGFLANLSTGTPLLVQTIVPTGAPSSPTQTAPLVISGTPAAAGSSMTALVIDTRALPSGSTIELQNVEFAAVIGDVRLTGGQGSQHVYGDGASQYIYLGPDDDELHGGGGNDTVGSAGGNDRLFGDSGDDTLFGGAGQDLILGGTGNDTVTYAGNRSEYKIERNGGIVTVRVLADATDADTLVGVETIRFADGTLALNEESASATTAQLTVGLYAALFERAPDRAGLQYWLGQAGDGQSLREIATSFAQVAKFDQLYAPSLSNAGFVDAIYQNILGIAGDLEGRAYWTGLIDAGLNRTDFVADFVTAALNFNVATSTVTGADLVNATMANNTLSNKVEVGLHFAAALAGKSNGAVDSAVYQRSLDVLANVTDASASVEDAVVKIDLIGGHTGFGSAVAEGGV